MENARFLEVEAQVRYWEDAEVNGESNEDGDNVPFKRDSLWCPVIDLKAGKILDWPSGTVASFHFKVCDQGEYFLLDEDKNRIARSLGWYVPDDFLCHGDQGYGDYIIFDVSEDGSILKYKEPTPDPEKWEKI